VTENAAAQLRRILSVIPQIADGEEHSIAELASRVGLDKETLLGDLRALAERYEVPGGFVDGMQIFIGPDTVSVNSDHFLRPMTLTISELRTLELGLSILRSERPPDETGLIERARQRLLTLIGKTPPDDPVEALRFVELAPNEGLPHLAIIRAALRDRRKVRLTYRGSGSTQSTVRVVRPYAMVAAAGMWYMVAYCESSDGLRVFRADRIEEAASLNDRYEIPQTFSLRDALHEGKALQVDSASTGMTVRYSPRIARWIAEREGKAIEPDGSVVLEHPLADAEWGVRHVLQYGPDAEVIEPQSMRHEIVRRLSRATNTSASDTKATS
jgi:proteasome accessory factor C